METAHQPNRRWSAGLTGLFALLVLGALSRFMLRPSSVPPDLPGPAAATPASPVEHAPRPVRGETAPVNFQDGMPVYPAGSAQVNGEGMVPHPITPTHERIFRENDLIGNLNGAMDVQDVAGLRALLKQYRDEYPEDAHVLADGYQLIADCLEHPGAETRAVAQRYYDEQRDSGLRRYIRRHCLEAPSP
jgi:hypothetical protein